MPPRWDENREPRSLTHDWPKRKTREHCSESFASDYPQAHYPAGNVQIHYAKSDLQIHHAKSDLQIHHAEGCLAALAHPKQEA